MKRGTIVMALPLALAFLCPATHGNPYSESYMAERPVPEQHRSPNIKDGRWKVVSASDVTALFIDSESIFISNDKAYFTHSMRLLTEAGKAPFSDHLPPGTPFGLELGARTEIDCALSRSRHHDMTFGDYFLGGHGHPIEGGGDFSKASHLNVSIFCLSDKEQTLRRLDELDKENRPELGDSLYGRYDQ